MRDVEILQNKKKFILAVINEEINIRNIKKTELVEVLHKKGVSRKGKAFFFSPFLLWDVNLGEE